MGLRFILGRAGTGKTQTCLQEIWGQLALDPIEGPPLILLVPEQASFQMEKALVTQGPTPGIMRAQVMSFRRLGWLVFQEAGGTNRQYLDELGKMMTLRSILFQEEDNLKVFGSLAWETGFVEKLGTTFKELKNYNITGEILRQQWETLSALEDEENHLLLQKLHDLTLLYGAYEDFLQGHETDPDDYLHFLAQAIKNAPSFQGARIWVDSFAGFTPREMDVLGSLMTHCQQLNISLCLDSGQLTEEISEMDLFHPSHLTYHKLQGLAHQLGVTIEPPKILDKQGFAPRFTNPSLAFLEKYYNEPDKQYSQSPKDIRLVRAANRRAEVEGVAREIIQLARERNYRYREMAVILREQTGYEELIHTVFSQYQLPFFMDAKRDVVHHPLVELLTATMETINTYWSYEPLFRYLKTDLTPIGREQVDILENYVLQYGIRGKEWLIADPWEYGLDVSTPEGKKKQIYLNKIREQAVAPLRNFYRRITGGKSPTVEEITLYFYELLQELEVPRQLETWCRQEEEAGDLDTAKEHSQLWDGVMNLFNQLVTALGKEAITLSQYANVLEAGLQTLQLGLIPPAMDQVLVGNIERSRQPELKAVFVLGVNEGVFPQRIKEDEIFTDEERELLGVHNMELAPTSKIQLFHEQYLAYIAFTRSREYLWVSYPEADENGKEMLPSILINRLRELFPQLALSFLAPEPGAGDFPPAHYLVHPQQAIAYLGEKLLALGEGEEIGEFWQEVYHWLIQRDQYKQDLKKILLALFHHNESIPLSQETLTSLYGNILRGSVSRLETFAACPFKHFLQYGLKLQEREIYQIDAPLRGEFYHQVLKELVEKIHDQGQNWGELTDESIDQMLEETITHLLPQIDHGILISSPRHHNWINIMKENLQTAVKVLTEHARLNTFQPVAVELAFGLDGQLPPISLELTSERQMTLRGRIDRVDLAQIEGQPLIRVVDYKSSSRGLDLNQCYYGLNLQLPVYLNVALEYYHHFTTQLPQGAGMLYFPVQSPVIRVANPISQQEAEEQRYQRLKMQGRILADPQIALAMGAQVGRTRLIDIRLTKDHKFYKGSKVLTQKEMDVLQKFTWYKLKELGEEIYQGETAIAPSHMDRETPCRFCSFKPCCQFDSLIPGNEYRFLPKLPEEILWEAVADTLAEGGAIP